jgi:hypothetical protein
MKFAALVAVAALAAAPSVFAQEPVKANIPFPFQVEGKTMPAGAYTFTPEVATDTVKVRGGSPPADAVALIITRVAAQFHPATGTPEHSHIVFDKVGNVHFLSEVWEPGMDGFLVYATKGKHEHVVIHVTK